VRANEITSNSFYATVHKPAYCVSNVLAIHESRLVDVCV